jgi:ATP-binding cassette, subfamily B, bacterial MsbA
MALSLELHPMTPDFSESVALYKRLLGYVAPYWRAFAASVLGMVIIAATEPALPALLKPMLDGTFVEKDPTWMKIVPPLIIAIMIVRGIASYVADFGSHWVGNKVVLDLRDAMFRKLVKFPVPFFENNVSGRLISKFAFDVAQLTEAATTVVTVLVKDGLAIVGLIAWLFYLNWKLSLITLLIAPPIMFIVRMVSRRLRLMSREAQHAMGDITQVLQEAIEGHKVMKIFGAQEYETRRFTHRANRLRSFVMKQASAAAASWPIVQLIAALGLAVIIYLATWQSAQDQTTVGGFVSFVVAMLMLISPLKRLTSVNERLQRGLAAAESVFDMLDQAPEVDTGSVRLPRARGEIRFENVYFAYPNAERPALHSISLAIRAGETVALVGTSGSGKTTLVNLIPRFYPPIRGRILLDGHDLATLTLESLRANIALVSQEVILFNDTIAANIAYGQADTSETDIIAAARAAHAWEFIEAMPERLNTLVGENGVRLSGGQRQRLALARTFLKNAPILILDEATSALDSESERHVQAALETLVEGRTTVLIAHRLSTVEMADRIVVLDAGRIAEEGTHRELLARDGIYAKLYRIQFAQTEPEKPIPAAQIARL